MPKSPVEVSPVPGERKGARLVGTCSSEMLITLPSMHKLRWFQKYLYCWSLGIFFPAGIAISNRRHRQRQPPAELSALAPKRSSFGASPHNSHKFSRGKRNFLLSAVLLHCSDFTVVTDTLKFVDLPGAHIQHRKISIQMAEAQQRDKRLKKGSSEGNDRRS